MGEGRRRCNVAVWGKRWRGMHRGLFQVPCGMAVRGRRRQSYTILRYIGHKEALHVRQTDSDILGSEYHHPMEARTR